MLFEAHDSSSGELLTDRSGLEDAVRGHGHLVFEVCKTVSLCHHGLAVFDNSDSHSGREFSAATSPRETNRSTQLYFDDGVVCSVALAQGLNAPARSRPAARALQTAGDRGRCHAAEHHDELAAALQLIELHSVPLIHRAGRTSNWR